MVTFHIDEFEAAQAHEPQVGRWTIGDTIYVLEQDGELPPQLQEDGA